MTAGLHITNEVANQVASFAIRGGPVENPLKLGLEGNETPTRLAILAALSKPGEHRTDVMASLNKILEQRSNSLVDFDVITAKLLAHIGIDPLMVAWLSAVCEGVSITRDKDFTSVVYIDTTCPPDESRTCSTDVWIGKDAWWKSCGTMMLYGIPNSVALATVGQPLKSLISHPVFDPLELTISRVLLPEGDECSEFEIDLVHEFPTPYDLFEMRPAHEKKAQTGEG